MGKKAYWIAVDNEHGDNPGEVYEQIKGETKRDAMEQLADIYFWYEGQDAGQSSEDFTDEELESNFKAMGIDIVEKKENDDRQYIILRLAKACDLVVNAAHAGACPQGQKNGKKKDSDTQRHTGRVKQQYPQEGHAYLAICGKM